MLLSQVYTLLVLLVGLAYAGELNVERDMCVAATKGHQDGQYVGSSFLDLEKKEKVTDEEMVKIAHEGSLEMRSSRDSTPVAKRPPVKTAIEVDNQIYLASSMKGDYSFIYEYKKNENGGKSGDGTIRKGVPKEIADALGDARSAGAGECRNNVQHKNDASSGELMANYTYLLKNSGQSLKDKKPKRTMIRRRSGRRRSRGRRRRNQKRMTRRMTRIARREERRPVLGPHKSTMAWRFSD